VIELSVDTSTLLMTFKNITTNKETSITLKEGIFGGEKEWKFCLFVWSGYSYTLVG